MSSKTWDSKAIGNRQSRTPIRIPKTNPSQLNRLSPTIISGDKRLMQTLSPMELRYYEAQSPVEVKVPKSTQHNEIRSRGQFFRSNERKGYEKLLNKYQTQVPRLHLGKRF